MALDSWYRFSVEFRLKLVGSELDGHCLDGLTATAVTSPLCKSSGGGLPTATPSVFASRACCGWPVVYYSPVSVAGNNQSCEKRSMRCSSQVRGLLSGVRQIILGCPKRWGRFG